MRNLKDIKGGRILAALLLGYLAELFLGRNDLPWTLYPGLLLLALAAWLFLQNTPGKAVKLPKLEARWEWTAGGLVLAAAIFFRLFRLGEIPPGLFPDVGIAALASERILKEGWRPFYELYHCGLGEQSFYYLLAGWFWLFKVSRLSVLGFSVSLSLMALVFCYFVFRQLGGSRVALLGCAIMGVLRWYLTFSRCGHGAFAVPFYMGGTLCFWLLAHRTDKKGAWAASMFFMILGLYSGLALKAFFVAVVLWALWEWGCAQGKRKKCLLKRYALYFPATLVLTIPVWVYMAVNRTMGPGSEGLSILSRVQQAGWGVFPAHLIHFALMFHRQSDPWGVHNWSNHPVLDAVTALLFLFGLVRAALNFRERGSYYALTGLVVMSLPALLSSADAPVSRSVGMIPFLVFLSGRALCEIWDGLRGWARFKALVLPAVVLILALIAGTNFKEYFYDQASQPGECELHWADATVVGERVARAVGDEIWLAPRYYRNADVDLLAFNGCSGFKPLKPWVFPGEGFPKVKRSLLFALDSGKAGVLQLLKKIYPGGSTEFFECPKGCQMVCFYRVPVETPRWRGKLGGIKGVYRLSEDKMTPPLLTRFDPVLNFTFRNDFGLGDFKSLWLTWTGNLVAPHVGPYSILVLTTDASEVWVDGRKVVQTPGNPEGVVNLIQGRHAIRVDFQKNSGVDTAFSLYWKTPGSQTYQVVPFWQWNGSSDR